MAHTRQSGPYLALALRCVALKRYGVMGHTVGGEVVARGPVFGGQVALGHQAPPILPHAFHKVDLPL